MTPQQAGNAFRRAVDAARRSGEWVRTTKSFEVEIDGVRCVALLMIQALVGSARSGCERATLDFMVSLTVAGERPEDNASGVGWLHVVSAPSGLAGASLLFDYALAEARRAIAAHPIFAARRDAAVLELFCPDPRVPDGESPRAASSRPRL